jgi:hypothetical protein
MLFYVVQLEFKAFHGNRIAGCHSRVMHVRVSTSAPVIRMSSVDSCGSAVPPVELTEI